MRSNKSKPSITVRGAAVQPASEWPSENQASRIALIAQLAQIVAIIVAGIWAGYVWVKTSLPSTKTGIQANGETSVAWSPTHNACKASFRLTVENIGSSVVTLEPVMYTVAPVASTRLEPNERFRVLSTVDALSNPVAGELRGLGGTIRPKEKRFKEVWFIFQPDRSRQYSIEAIIDDNKPDALSKWHAEIESCDEPLSTSK